MLVNGTCLSLSNGTNTPTQFHAHTGEKRRAQQRNREQNKQTEHSDDDGDDDGDDDERHEEHFLFHFFTLRFGRIWINKHNFPDVIDDAKLAC